MDLSMDVLNEKQKERVGIITVSSGKLIIADPDKLEDSAHFVIDGLARNTEIEVFGKRSEFSPWLESLTLIFDDHNHGEKRTEVIHNLGRFLLFADPKAIEHYGEITDELQQDLEFWGGDEDSVARASHAVRLDDGKWGFSDLPVDVLNEKKHLLEEFQTSGKMITWGEKKHTNTDQLFMAINTSPTSSGSAEIEGCHVFSCQLPASAEGGSADVIIYKTLDDKISRVDISF